MIRDLRRIGQIWFRIFPSKPITSKPLKTRMGKGKGSVQFWAAPIKAGQIIFEINGGISYDLAKIIIQKASQKLPIKTKFVAYNSANMLSSKE
jgi:large subunit ribosomal protein L16